MIRFKMLRFILLSAFLLRGGIAVKAGDTLTIENYLLSKNIKAEKTKEGIFYTIENDGKGELPKQGDYVKMKYSGKLLEGKKFDESPKDEPFIFQLGYRQVIQGWDIVIPKLKVGTKATLYIPSDFAYGNSGIGDVIPPNTPLVFEIDLQSVLSSQDYDSHMRQLEDSERVAFQKKSEEQFIKDKKLIQEYAIAHKLKMSRMDKGVSYLITKQGKGNNAKEGNRLTVQYDGFLLDDKVFDTTKDKQPFSFILGEGKAIEGWEVALKNFNKGSEGYLMIPSKLAYGATPIEDSSKTLIPPHSVLIFKIQVLDIQQVNQ
jgi:FKBP-type peptidyl-prolyl cis-trans isomerase